MKFLYLSAVTIFFMANALFAQESIDYEPLQRFSQEYYKSSQDKLEVKKAAAEFLEDLIQTRSQKDTYKNPQGKVDKIEFVYLNSSDLYLRNLIYYFTRDTQMSVPLSLALSHNQKKLNEPKDLYSAISRLAIKKRSFDYETIMAPKDKAESDAKNESYFEDILEASKAKIISFEQQEFIASAIDIFISSGVRHSKNLPQTYLNIFEDNKNHLNPFLYDFFKMKALFHSAPKNGEPANFNKKKAYETGKSLFEKNPQSTQVAYQLMLISALLKNKKEETDKWFFTCTKLSPEWSTPFDRYLFLVHKKYDDIGIDNLFSQYMSNSYKTPIPGVLLHHTLHLINSHHYGSYEPVEDIYDKYLHDIFKKYEELHDQGKYIHLHKYYYHQYHFEFAYRLKKYKHLLVLDQKYREFLSSSYRIKSLKTPYNEIISEAKLKLSNVSAIFDDIDKKLRTRGAFATEKQINKLEEELQDYAKSNPDKDFQFKFKTLLSLLKEKKDFVNFKKIPFTLNSSNSHWFDVSGTSSGISSERFSMDTYGNRKVLLKASYRIAFEPPYEISVDLNLPGGSPVKENVHMGILLGNAYENNQGISYWIDRSNKVFGIYSNGEKLFEKSRKFPPTTTLKITVDSKNKCTFYLGKNKVFEYAAGNVDLSLITLGVPPWNKISDMGIFQKPWIKKVKEEK